MPFRLSSKNVFLTYPRCDSPKEELLAHLVTLLTAYTPHIRVAHELHDDEGHHLHAFIRLERKLDTRSERFFDYRGFHPNIVSKIRSLVSVFEYVSKDEDYCDHGQPDPGSLKDKWKTIHSSTTAEEFWTSVQELAPRDSILNLEKLEYYVQKKFGEQILPYQSPWPGFNTAEHPQLQEWADSSLNLEVCLAVRLAPPAPRTRGGARIC